MCAAIDPIDPGRFGDGSRRSNKVVHDRQLIPNARRGWCSLSQRWNRNDFVSEASEVSGLP
jgi:hypothetical protein